MQSKKIRLLIFGSGFIAENFIQHFSGLYGPEFSVKVLYHRHKIKTNYPFLEQIPFNIENLSAILDDFTPHFAMCVHGNSFVSSSINVRESMENNVLKTMSFLETLSRSGARKYLRKILVVGSASEYGKYYHDPIKEDFPLHATSLYGLSKICLFNASMYYFERGLPIVHVRQFNTVGPRQREVFVLPSFCKQIAETEKGIKPPSITVGDLNQERDFIDIRDTCRAYSLLLESGENGNVYNVASGKYISIRELLNRLLTQSKHKNKVKIIENPQLLTQENSLSNRLHADISKIQNLGFSLKYSLKDTIESTLEFWRGHV